MNMLERHVLFKNTQNRRPLIELHHKLYIGVVAHFFLFQCQSVLVCRGLAASYGYGSEKDQNRYNSFGIIVSYSSIGGAKTQNFPDRNFFCAKKIRTKRAKPFLATNLKNACLPLMTLPKNTYSMFLSYNTIYVMVKCTVLKSSKKWQMIWKNSDSLSGFPVIRTKAFRTRINFPGSNATLLPRFLRLSLPIFRRFFFDEQNEHTKSIFTRPMIIPQIALDFNVACHQRPLIMRSLATSSIQKQFLDIQISRYLDDKRLYYWTPMSNTTIQNYFSRCTG